MIKHMVTPMKKPPKGYTCRLCSKKALPGQPVIFSKNDFDTFVCHAACMKGILNKEPELDPTEKKAKEKFEEEQFYATEFERLRDEYASRIRNSSK